MQLNLSELNRLPLSRGSCRQHKFRVSASGSSERKFPIKLPNGQSLRQNLKLKDIDPNDVQKRLSSLISKTHNFWNEVTSPLVNTRKPVAENASDPDEDEEIFVGESTIQPQTSKGNLSREAIISIEQFSRMNGLSGKKMQKIFQALLSGSLSSDARHLVEFCCFRFLSRESSDIHLRLKEMAFQRLMFITMLAWEKPYAISSESDDNARRRASLKAIMQSRLVQEEAFVRIAPSLPWVADRSTAHNLFKVLAADKGGISFSIWSSYVGELLRVHEEQKSYTIPGMVHRPSEKALCVSSSRLEVVLLWDGNILRPGTLTLTNKALYFEAVGFLGNKIYKRLDISGPSAKVEKKRVGPLESLVFESAVSISSGTESGTWILEFVNLGGEIRKDIWHAYISEVIALHSFIRQYAPREDDQLVSHVYGALKGKEKATAIAISSIARLLALQSKGKLLDDPSKLVQFTYLHSSPYGQIVCQTLAVSCWGGPLVGKSDKALRQSVQEGEGSDSLIHVYDLDGSVYLRQWMRSPSWVSRDSISFWRNVSVKGVVLSKHLVVADTSLVERAARACRAKRDVVEKTQATVDAAKLEGIPSNIDLFWELLLPLTKAAQKFEKLRRWEEPPATVLFLGFVFTIVYRNLVSYVLPTTLIAISTMMLLFKLLKERGFLRRSFETVAIRDQAPSNTIQQIIALKKAIRDMESLIQNLNVSLLKTRTIILAGQPRITTEVSLALLFGGITLLIVPGKYIMTFLLVDLFTRELEFRRETVMRFRKILKERWDSIYAAPVIVLPYENTEPGSAESRKETEKRKKISDKTHTDG